MMAERCSCFFRKKLNRLQFVQHSGMNANVGDNCEIFEGGSEGVDHIFMLTKVENGGELGIVQNFIYMVICIYISKENIHIHSKENTDQGSVLLHRTRFNLVRHVDH